jgi:hypothetical protein
VINKEEGMKRYISQCDYLGEQMVETPDGDLCLYVEVEAERAKDREEIARLRKALEFYAPPVDILDFEWDMGKIAREALEGK